MNYESFLFVALVSVILATGVFNTEPKNSDENKKTEVIVKESSETKPTEEEVKAEAQAQAEAEAQAKARSGRSRSSSRSSSSS